MKVYVEDTSIAARKAEIDIKLARVRELIDQEGLSGVLLMKHQNFAWITAGSNSIVTLYVELGVAYILVTKDTQYAITNVIEAPRMIQEEKLEELGFQLVVTDWYEDQIPGKIKEICGDLSNIACDMHYQNTKFMQDKINPLHYSLTENEIGRYMHLGDTLSQTLEEYIVTVRPGMTEYEITGGLTNALWSKGIDQALFLVATDKRAYDHRHAIPTGKVLEKHLCISVNGRYKGLITTVTRMVHFGKKDEEIARIFDVCTEVEARSIAAIQVGQDDIAGFRACKKAYEDLGHGDMWPLHGQGGAQSYNNRDYMLTESSHRITVPNQGYCFNPVINGAKAEDAFIATENGPLMITKPFSFPAIEKNCGGTLVKFPNIVFVDS